MKSTLLLYFLLATYQLTAQTLNPTERQLIDNINKNMPRTLRLLEEMVNINSGTLNVQGVRKTGDVLRKEFDKIGFTTEWVTLPDSLKRAGHLVASVKGKKGKKLFLIGHLDTVFEPDMPPNPFKLLNDSTATGQGVNDMKGGDVVMLAALQALQQAGLLKNVSVTAYFTGDEEKAGVPVAVSRADFIERAGQCNIGLAFESAQGLHSVATARRGSSSWRLTVTGKQAHSATIFSSGYGAIYEASRILNTFREQLSTEKFLTFNPGIFAGGAEMKYDSNAIQAKVTGKTNIISPAAIVQGDLRFLTEAQKESARTRMKAIVDTGNLAGTSATITFTDGIPAMEPTEGNQLLVALLNTVSTDMGIGETQAGDPGARGAGDVSYIARYMDCLDGLGASGRGAHAPGETINLNEFPKLIQRTAILLYRLTR